MEKIYAIIYNPVSDIMSCDQAFTTEEAADAELKSILDKGGKDVEWYVISIPLPEEIQDQE